MVWWHGLDMNLDKIGIILNIVINLINIVFRTYICLERLDVIPRVNNTLDTPCRHQSFFVKHRHKGAVHFTPYLLFTFNHINSAPLTLILCPSLCWAINTYFWNISKRLIRSNKPCKDLNYYIQRIKVSISSVFSVPIYVR